MGTREDMDKIIPALVTQTAGSQRSPGNGIQEGAFVNWWQCLGVIQHPPASTILSGSDFIWVGLRVLKPTKTIQAQGVCLQPFLFCYQLSSYCRPFNKNCCWWPMFRFSISLIEYFKLNIHRQNLTLHTFV